MIESDLSVVCCTYYLTILFLSGLYSMNCEVVLSLRKIEEKYD